MEKVILSKEKETLLIPLYGKAMENRKKTPILKDVKAEEIVSRIEYDFRALRIPEKTNLMMCLRAKLIDNFVREFLSGKSGNVALHLGCGLDSRYNRIENPHVDWYDVDFSEVIDIRKHFYKETDHYHLIGSSVTEAEWLKKIPQSPKHALVIAEGLLMYLTEDDIRTLLGRLSDRLGTCTLVFDAFSSYAARKVRNHPSIKKTGAAIHWGIDDPVDMEKWGVGLRFIGEKYFTANEEIPNLITGARILFRIANLFPAAKKAQRILVYEMDKR